MTDKRVKEFNDEWFKCYQAKYTIYPIWSDKDWGLNGKIAKNLWAWADKNQVTEMEMYNALHSFFEKDGPHSYEMFYKLVTEFVAKIRHGQKIVQKAKEMFANSQARMEERLKVEEKTATDFASYFASRYTKDKFGCQEWARKQKSTLNLSEAMKNKESPIYKLWVKEGKAAREYFGDELVNECWRVSEENKEERKKMLLKQKEILTNSQSQHIKESV